MPVFTMPALFLAHSAKEGREDFPGRGIVAGRLRGRMGFLSVSVMVLMVANCACLFPLSKCVCGRVAAHFFFCRSFLAFWRPAVYSEVTGVEVWRIMDSQADTCCLLWHGNSKSPNPKKISNPKYPNFKGRGCASSADLAVCATVFCARGQAGDGRSGWA